MRKQSKERQAIEDRTVAFVRDNPGIGHKELCGYIMTILRWHFWSKVGNPVGRPYPPFHGSYGYQRFARMCLRGVMVSLTSNREIRYYTPDQLPTFDLTTITGRKVAADVLEERGDTKTATILRESTRICCGDSEVPNWMINFKYNVR